MTAIILIGLLGVTLAAMSAFFAQQMNRTQQTRRDAQLRQMLLAGAATVDSRRSTWPAEVAEQNWTIPLPSTLAEEGATLSVHITPLPASTPSPTLHATIEGKLNTHTSRQILTLTRTDAQWRITQSHLEP
jgi:hypothetical protein